MLHCCPPILHGQLGRILISSEPQPHRGELAHGEEVGGELVVAGSDAAEVLQLREEALDQVALAVEALAEAGFPAPVSRNTAPPLYAARIEDLGLGDFVKVDCAACHHVALLTP